eukprot:g5169.t1
MTSVVDSHANTVRPSIVIVGAPQAGKHSLASGLHSCAVDNVVERAVCRTETVNDSSEYDVSLLTISNKYYSAQVEVWVLINASAGDKVSLPSTCQALISVFSAHLEGAASFEIAKAACSADNVPGCRMLVSTHSDCAHAESKAVRDQANTWCIEELIEFVEADCSNPLHSNLEREKSSVARVYECLQTVMWDNIQPVAGKPRTVSNKEKSEMSLPDEAATDAPGPGNRAPASSATAPAQDGPGINADGVQHPAQLDVASLFSDLGNLSEDTEELFELISQAKQIREGSLNGSLSDEERFAQAEKTAIRLAELFGLDEEAGK